MLFQYLDRASRIAALSQRFASIGLPRTWALNKERRHQMAIANLDMLPPSLRSGLGVCIDAGANVGAWSLAVLDMLHAPRVLAFEPQQEPFARLADALAPYRGAEVYRVGLGSARATMSLRVQPDSVFTSFLEPQPDMRGGDERFVDTEVAPLDDFTGGIEQVGILKLDVQGFERQVIAGAEETLKRTRCVCVEVMYESHYRGDDDFDALHRMFSDRGFRLYGITEPARSEVDHRPLWADAVYVRR